MESMISSTDLEQTLQDSDNTDSSTLSSFVGDIGAL